jgi:hypothetical protein
VDSHNELSLDYINFGDKKYLNAWELFVVDTATLNMDLGSRLAPLYAIAGYPDRDVIAVKDESTETCCIFNTTGYSIYYLFEGSHSKLLELQVSKGSQLLRMLEGTVTH